MSMPRPQKSTTNRKAKKNTRSLKIHKRQSKTRHIPYLSLPARPIPHLHRGICSYRGISHAKMSMLVCKTSKKNKTDRKSHNKHKQTDRKQASKKANIHSIKQASEQTAGSPQTGKQTHPTKKTNKKASKSNKKFFLRLRLQNETNENALSLDQWEAASHAVNFFFMLSANHSALNNGFEFLAMFHWFVNPTQTNDEKKIRIF